MHFLAQLAFIGLASAAVISPVSRDTSTFSGDLTKCNKPSGHWTSLSFSPQRQPSFCPYDTNNGPQPLLSYDESTAPHASDCAHIVDMLNKKNVNNPNFLFGVKGYWTFDVSELDGEGINLISHKSCVFRMKRGDGEVEGGKKKVVKQFNFGVDELKTYLGSWLVKQRHGFLGAVGTTDCWVEGEKKKEEGGVRVRWIVGKVGEREEKAIVEVPE